MTLGLLVLAAALLAGGFALSTAATRASRSARAATVAHTLATRALGRALVEWSRTEDGLAVGASVERPLPEFAALSVDAADTRLRVQRLSARLFVLAVDVRVPATGTPLARRRMRLLVERQVAADTTLFLIPRRLARWPVADLY